MFHLFNKDEGQRLHVFSIHDIPSAGVTKEMSHVSKLIIALDLFFHVTLVTYQDFFVSHVVMVFRVSLLPVV